MAVVITLPVVVALTHANPVGVAIGFGCVIVVGGVAVGVSYVWDKVANIIAKKRESNWMLANQCKGITKQGKQCRNLKDCPHHSN